jgi:hypothetical protein
MLLSHLIYFNLMLPTVIAVVYTPGNLFDALDLDNNGLITEKELNRAVVNMDTIHIDKTHCSCFSCEGRILYDGDTCDIYDNSGCSNPDNMKTGCYTTNEMKCNCNLFSKNHDICKIPLTHSFTNYTPPITANHNFHLKTRSQRAFSNSHTTKSDSHQSNYHSRLDTTYQHGRNSAWNDIADAVMTYHTVDAGLTIFGAVLEDKN